MLSESREIRQFKVETKLNGRIDISLTFGYTFIPINDKQIEQEKKRFYKFARVWDKEKNETISLKEVPYLFIMTASLRNNEKTKELWKFFNDLSPGKNLTFFPQSGEWVPLPQEWLTHLFPSFSFNPAGIPETQEGALFHMLLEAKLDNEYNADISMFTKIPSKFLYNDVRKTFDQNTEEFIESERLIRFKWTKPIVQRWLAIKTHKDIEKVFSIKGSAITNKKFEPVVSIQSWAHYLKEALFQNPESLFNKVLKKSGNRYSLKGYEFMVIDVNDKTVDWRELFETYRAQNKPKFKITTELELNDGPFDYHLLDRKYLNIIVIHKTENNLKMVGYITCSLKPILNTSKAKFDSVELNQLNDILKENKVKKIFDGCGFDAFGIDGIHIHKDHRNQPIFPGITLSKMLVFCSMEFIRLTHNQLGAKLIMVDSLALATKQILVGTFGFTHYNRRNDFKWMLENFHKYSQLRGSAASTTNTPKFLTLSYLHAKLVEFKEQYYTYNNGRMEPRYYASRVQSLNEFIAKMAWLNKSFQDIDLSLTGSSWPVHKEDVRIAFPQSEFTTLIYKLSIYFNYHISDLVRMTKEKEKEDEYMKSIRVFLNTMYDDEDTLLFIRDNKDFVKRMINFANSVKIHINNEIVIHRIEIDLDDLDVEAIEPKKTNNNEELYNPTENDIIEYEEVLKIVQKDSREKEEIPIISFDEEQKGKEVLDDRGNPILISIDDSEESQSDNELSRIEGVITEMNKNLQQEVVLVKRRREEMEGLINELQEDFNRDLAILKRRKENIEIITLDLRELEEEDSERVEILSQEIVAFEKIVEEVKRKNKGLERTDFEQEEEEEFSEEIVPLKKLIKDSKRKKYGSEFEELSYPNASDDEKRNKLRYYRQMKQYSDIWNQLFDIRTKAYYRENKTHLEKISKSKRHQISFARKVVRERMEADGLPQYFLSYDAWLERQHSNGTNNK